MTYGYVYVAQVSIGASQMQLFNVLKECRGLSRPVARDRLCPCINHGIKGGMTRTQTVGKEAVACGYWHLWHYNPQLEEQGKNPFVMDSKGAGLVEVPRLPDEGGALHFAQKVVPGRGRRSCSQPPRRTPNGVTTATSALRRWNINYIIRYAEGRGILPRPFCISGKMLRDEKTRVRF